MRQGSADGSCGLRLCSGRASCRRELPRRGIECGLLARLIFAERPKVHEELSAAAQFCADCCFEFAGLLSPLIAQFLRMPSGAEMKSGPEGFLPGRQPVQKLRGEPGLLPGEHAFLAGQRKFSPVVRLQYDDAGRDSLRSAAPPGCRHGLSPMPWTYRTGPGAGSRKPGITPASNTPGQRQISAFAAWVALHGYTERLADGRAAATLGPSDNRAQSRRSERVPALAGCCRLAAPERVFWMGRRWAPSRADFPLRANGQSERFVEPSAQGTTSLGTSPLFLVQSLPG